MNTNHRHRLRNEERENGEHERLVVEIGSSRECSVSLPKLICKSLHGEAALDEVVIFNGHVLSS